MIKIQKTKYTPLHEMSGLTWYFIGPPKSGKTTNASRWSKDGSKRTLLLDTDKGSDFMVDQDVIPIDFLNAPVNEQGQILEPEERGRYFRNNADKGKPMPVYSMDEVLTELYLNKIPDVFETIVLDTVDKLNEWAEKKVKAELAVDDIADAPFGSGWSKSRDYVLQYIVALQEYCKRNSKNLVLISHSKETVVTDNKFQLSPELPRGLAKRITALSDAIGYSTFDKETGKPMLSFESYDERSVGSRIPSLHNKVFEFDYKEVMKAELEEEPEETPSEPMKSDTQQVVLNNEPQTEMEIMNA